MLQPCPQAAFLQTAAEMPVVVAEHPRLVGEARAIASAFDLKYAVSGEQLPRFVLSLTHRHLELRDTRGILGKGLSIDFTRGTAHARSRRGNHSKEPLARAVGIRARCRPRVLDATAGVGRDALVLAALGCNVVMCERAPAVAALLHEALSRAGRDPDFVERIGNRLRLRFGNAVEVLTRLSGQRRPQVVYIDPMYPYRPRAAQVKREMQYLRALVGADTDGAVLLSTALEAASKRVVVKRRRTDPMLSALCPSHSIVSGQIRFDVYMTASE